MKKIEWINGNKMKFISGHKTFDNQCNYLGTGNVEANTQYYSFIRAWNDDGKDLMDHDRNKREPGHLFNFDVNPFRQSFPEFRYIEKQLIEESKEWKESHILYAFFHHNEKKRILHGFILTDKNHNYVRTYYFSKTYKSENILTECRKYICNDN